jgi:hypothetical protein
MMKDWHEVLVVGFGPAALPFGEVSTGEDAEWATEPLWGAVKEINLLSLPKNKPHP